MYGSAIGVANLSGLWTVNGRFFDNDISQPASAPTLTAVNTWLDEVSKLLDVALSDEGFKVPVTELSALPMLNGLVQGIVKDIADYSHGSGRYYTDKVIDQGSSPFMMIAKELSEWVQSKSKGLEGMGLEKTSVGRKSTEVRMI